MKTIGALAKPFTGGGGPTHAQIEVAFTSADAFEYLPSEGNKQNRVLTGLRLLRSGGRVESGSEPLPADHEKLAAVAEHLAGILVSSGLVEADEVGEALEGAPSSSDASAASLAGLGDAGPGPRAADTDGPKPADPRGVMVVHGQDEAARKAMFGWLRSIGLKPREWTQLVADTDEGSPYIGDVLDRAFEQAAAVVVLFTPDEHVLLRDGLRGRGQGWRLQARPNVMFEAGSAFARHPKRTVLVVLGDQELPSDLAGRHYVRLGTVRALRDLASRLRKAGCPVDESGDDWLDVDQFPDRSIDADPAA